MKPIALWRIHGIALCLTASLGCSNTESTATIPAPAESPAGSKPRLANEHSESPTPASGEVVTVANDTELLQVRPAIVDLLIYGPRVSGEKLRKLELPDSLSVLSISNFPDLPAGALPRIDHLSDLTELKLHRLSVSDDELVHLGAQTRLKVLSLQETKVTNATCEQIAKLKNLRRLVLSGTAIDDDGLAALMSLQNLESLYLIDTGTTNRGAGYLAELRGLKSLHLDGTKITDAGLKPLATLPRLEILSVPAPRISDVGINYLRLMPNLKLLYIGGPRGATFASEHAMQQLQNDRPELEILR